MKEIGTSVFDINKETFKTLGQTDESGIAEPLRGQPLKHPSKNLLFSYGNKSVSVIDIEAHKIIAQFKFAD